MFDVYCPQHGTRVLLDCSAIDAMTSTDTGIRVHFHCNCGYAGVWVTGTKAHRAA